MRIKNKKAFTLIEVIVVVALVGIVGTAIVSMMVPASNVFGRVADEVETKMKAGQVMQTLVPQTRYAGELVIGSDPSLIGGDSGKRYLYAQDGKVYLYKDGAVSDIFTDEFYSGCTVDFSFLKLENNLIEVTLEVTQTGGGSRSELKTSVRVLNTQEIGGTEGDILTYTWDQVPAGT
jgi:prepilin-type N-terminal cleavage/methylation domain-containing protein